jgi:signal peptidase II
VRKSSRTLVIIALVAIIVFALDQFLKYQIVSNLKLGDERSVIGEILKLHFVANSGAAFSLGSGSTWIFAVIATLVAVFIVVFAHRIRSVGWAFVFGLLLGGTLGNLSDRLFREPGFGVGHVIDFFQIIGFPAIFNIADIAIVSSMGLFIILSLRGIGLDGKRATRTAKSDATADTDATADPDGT